jgi:hypothetical protein
MQAAAPRELDLAQFAKLPGRNGVWVEEAAPQQTGARQQTALEKLRQVPPQKLSLIQMVERFAAALHEHQQGGRASLAKNASHDPSPHPSNGQAQRDAALAEALKALTLFTQGGFDQDGFDKGGPESQSPNQVSDTTNELRVALAKLQNLRGAA